MDQSPPIPSQPLDYQSPPSRADAWKCRLLTAARILLAHVAAILVMVLVAIVLPVIGTAALYITVASSQAADGKPIPSPNGIGLIFTLFQIASGIVALVLILAFILLDLLRRLLRQGPWRTLAFVTVLIVLSVTIWMLQQSLPTPEKLRAGAVIILTLESLFCAYWLPLAITESLLNFLIRRFTPSRKP